MIVEFKLPLQVHADSGREPVAAAIYMRLEGDAVRVDLTQSGERHDLKSAGIRQDGSRPVHEPVQATQSGDAVRPRAEHQVIGIAQDALRSGGPDGVGRHPLDGACGPDRHEGRCIQRPVGGMQDAGTCRAVECRGLEAKVPGQG